MVNMRQVCDFNTRSSHPSLQVGMRNTLLTVFTVFFCSFAGLSYSAEGAGPGPQKTTVLDAMHLEGFMNGMITATGRAQISQPNLEITADQIQYLVPDERCMAEGQMVLNRDQNLVYGPKGEYSLKDHTGFIEQPELSLPAGPDRMYPFRGSAMLGVFLDELHSRFDQAHFSTCAPGSEDWYLTASDLTLDSGTQIGEGTNARIVFEGVPLVYSPYITFPMNDHRKSGFLAPDFGTTNNGFEITTPYYINIAPNLDDTLIPREMSKRGLMIANEFRYLEPGVVGKLALEYLDHDRLTGTNRYFGSLTQQAQLGNGFALSINAQETSDNAYFRDLGSTVIPNANAAANPYLPRDFLLTKQFDFWTLQLHTLSFQTLNDPNKPIADQYRMRPQFVANYSSDLLGMDFDFNNEFTDFLHSDLGSNIQGQRYVSVPSLKLPINLGYGFIAPKFSLHYTDYNLQSGTRSGLASNLTGQNVSRTLPISSLDTGLFFDRELEWNDKPITQTLEPRLYYVYIPYKDQSAFPLFNTGVADFSYSQLFSENQFSGPDRINEANQVTAAVQSRLIDSRNGAELLRGLIGQRYYFEAQQTAIAGQTTRTSNSSDILAGLSGRISKEVTSSFLWDYNPTLQRTEKFSLDTRYVPEPGQAINLSYRINRDTVGQADIRQIDASAELPLGRGWSGVVRVNYDTAQSTLVESLFGAEYTAGCWAFRVVTDRKTVSSTQVDSVLYMQLELNGMVRLGKNPLEALKTNIPGYRKTNEIY